MQLFIHAGIKDNQKKGSEANIIFASTIQKFIGSYVTRRIQAKPQLLGLVMFYVQ